MKVVVVGCTHAGTSAVKSILANHPEAEVTVYEEMTIFPSYLAELPCTLEA